MDDPPSEIHIVNGLHPGLPFSYYEELLRGFKRIKPDVHLKCFTAVEIHFFAEHYDMTYEEVLEKLRAAGLDSLPGGGAEIFHPDVRTRISARQGDRRRVPRGAPRRAQHGHAHQRDDALRSRRDVRAPRRPHAAPARAAGRDERLPGVHPARVPPRRQRDEEPPRADGRGRSAHHRRLAPPARQRRAHQGVLGLERARRRADRAALRRRRHRRHHRARDDLSRGRIARSAGARVRRSRSPHPRGGTHARRARHALQRRPRAPARRAARGRREGARPQGASATWRCAREPTLRVAGVGYLNARPLWERARRGAARVERSSSAASQRGRALLAEDEADVALLPVAAAASLGDATLVDAAASRRAGPFAACVVYSECPIDEIEELALDLVVAHERRPRARPPRNAESAEASAA